MATCAKRRGEEAELSTSSAPTEHRSAKAARRLLQLEGLSLLQSEAVGHFLSAVDVDKESLVVSNPHAPGNPIVWVSPPWQDMCGFSAAEAVGRNPRLTQGERTDKSVIQAISTALGQQRACKVQIINYRGGQPDRPFWNMLSIMPVHHRGQLQLYVASLQDYSYHIGQMVSLTPAQFCRAASHYQRHRQLGDDTLTTLQLAKPTIYEVDREYKIDDPATPPLVRVPPVKRLGWTKLDLEPEHLADRVADVLESIEGCQYEVTLRGSDYSDSTIICLKHEGVAMRVMIAEEPNGEYCISCTRISGDTFAYHNTFRQIRDTLGHALTKHPLVTPRLRAPGPTITSLGVRASRGLQLGVAQMAGGA